MVSGVAAAGLGARQTRRPSGPQHKLAESESQGRKGAPEPVFLSLYLSPPLVTKLIFDHITLPRTHKDLHFGTNYKAHSLTVIM